MRRSMTTRQSWKRVAVAAAAPVCVLFGARSTRRFSSAVSPKNVLLLTQFGDLESVDVDVDLIWCIGFGGWEFWCLKRL